MPRNIILTICLLFITYISNSQQKSLEIYIDSFAKGANFNGTIYIQAKQPADYKKSFGYANMEFKVPARLNTRYRIASITKLFTSVLIMQLSEKGLLDVSKTIGVYLRDYKGPARDKVTIKQLLNHTSGIRNMDTVSSMESALSNGVGGYQHPYTTDQLLAIYGSDSLVHQPGEVYDYNNAEYIVLGKIIEKLAGAPYEKVLQRQILRPLNMNNTGLYQQGKIIDSLADTYFYRDDIRQLVPDLPVYWENWYASGSMYSTAGDLRKFSNALFNKKLLSQASLDEMFTAGKDEYGYGMWVYMDYDIKGTKYTIIKRPGRIMGAQGMLFHVLGTGTTIIILSNTGTISLDEFAAEIANRIVP